MGWLTNGVISQSLRERQQFTGLANFTSMNKRESVSNSYHSLLDFLRLLDFIASQIIQVILSVLFQVLLATQYEQIRYF